MNCKTWRIGWQRLGPISIYPLDETMIVMVMGGRCFAFFARSFSLPLLFQQIFAAGTKTKRKLSHMGRQRQRLDIPKATASQFNFRNMCRRSDPDIVLVYLKVFLDKRTEQMCNSYVSAWREKMSDMLSRTVEFL